MTDMGVADLGREGRGIRTLFRGCRLTVVETLHPPPLGSCLKGAFSWEHRAYRTILTRPRGLYVERGFGPIERR